MNNITLIAAGLCSLTLVVWAVLRHRRAEVSKYPLSWKGWIIRLLLVGVGVVLLFATKEHAWSMFAGAALVVLPLLFRQIPYEIATRLFRVKGGSAENRI